MRAFIVPIILITAIFVIIATTSENDPYAKAYDDLPDDELLEMFIDREIQKAFDACGLEADWEKIYLSRN